MGRTAYDEKTIDDFLGSAQVFTSAVNGIVEQQLLDEVAGKTLTLSQFKLLKMVSLTNARTITDVALFLSVSAAAASKAVDKLVRRKLLRRVEGHPDRREIQLSLTPTSRRYLQTYDERKQRKLATIFRRYSAGDLKRTAKLLDQLSAGLVDHASDPDEVCLQCGIYFRERCLVRQLAKRNCFYLLNGSHHKHHVEDQHEDGRHGKGQHGNGQRRRTAPQHDCETCNISDSCPASTTKQPAD
jgi:DNA-binding MarR family transcriptional regulator